MYAIYIYMCVCMYVCMHACMYVCMHACMYVYMYACTYVCMYVCMYIYISEVRGVCHLYSLSGWTDFGSLSGPGFPDNQ